MTTNSRTSRRLAAGSLAAAAVAVLAAANPAVGTSHSADDAACSFDRAFLPHTADAVQGWYDQCRSQQHFSTTKAGLPAGDDWYVQRKTGDVFVTNTGPPSSGATETPSTNRPTDWRALMNEVPEATETTSTKRPANWRALMNEVPEAPQPLGRPAPFTYPEHKGFRGVVLSGAGHPAWTGNRSPMSTERAQERVRKAFERGVGPGQNLYGQVVSG